MTNEDCTIINFNSIFFNIHQSMAGNKAVGVMKAGQTFTIEPMINAGTTTELFYRVVLDIYFIFAPQLIHWCCV